MTVESIDKDRDMRAHKLGKEVSDLVYEKLHEYDLTVSHVVGILESIKFNLFLDATMQMEDE